MPWPGVEAFVDCRLSVQTGWPVDSEAIRREAIDALFELPPEALSWRPRLVLALGSRSSRGPKTAATR